MNISELNGLHTQIGPSSWAGWNHGAPLVEYGASKEKAKCMVGYLGDACIVF